jgi:septin 4
LIHVSVCTPTEGGTVMMVEIDHDAGRVYTEPLADVMMSQDGEPVAGSDSTFEPSPKAIQTRLTSPIVTTYIDTEKISFERYLPGMIH